MRHRVAGRKLNRTTSHRKALLRTMVTQLLDQERMITTVPKAKELRPFVEKMISLGKRETLHARRQALAVIRRKEVVRKLFDDLAPRFAQRNGGYTRIVRLGRRKGDGSEMALIELIGSELEAPAPEKKGRKKKKAKPEAAAESQAAVPAKKKAPKKRAVKKKTAAKEETSGETK